MIIPTKHTVRSGCMIETKAHLLNLATICFIFYCIVSFVQSIKAREIIVGRAYSRQLKQRLYLIYSVPVLYKQQTTNSCSINLCCGQTGSSAMCMYISNFTVVVSDRSTWIYGRRKQEQYHRLQFYQYKAFQHRMWLEWNKLLMLKKNYCTILWFSHNKYVKIEYSIYFFVMYYQCKTR